MKKENDVVVKKRGRPSVSKVRDELFLVVKANPGVTSYKAHRLMPMKCSLRNVYYQMRELEKEGKVFCSKMDFYGLVRVQWSVKEDD